MYKIYIHPESLIFSGIFYWMVRTVEDLPKTGTLFSLKCCILLTMENTSVFLKFGFVAFNFIRLWCSLKFFINPKKKLR